MGYLVAVLFSAAVLIEGALRACPRGWINQRDSCYKFYSGPADWYSAKSTCESHHGKLAEVGHMAEKDFLACIIRDNQAKGAWIGLGDFDHEGDWRYASSGGQPPMTNWVSSEGEPINYNGQEECATINVAKSNGQRHDQNCLTDEKAFICKIKGAGTGRNTGRTSCTSNRQTDADYIDYPFRNTSLPWDQRVDDLVNRLTLEEIQGQLANGGADRPTPRIDRLGIGAYQFWTNCNHGDASAPGNATAFPQDIGIAASFDPNLRFRVAEAAAVEVRAKHTYFMKQEIYDFHTGLSCFSPDLDILKHPYWGRNQETHGECPYLARVYADRFIKGIQGDHPRYARVTAGCKHFAVHSGPEEAHGPNGHRRFGFDSKASMADMRMTFLPGFRQCVESGTYSFMSSYNEINGVPVAANKWLLTDLTRNEWNFTGYILSDAGAIESVVWASNYTHTAVDTVAACINAGLNIETSYHQDNPYFMSMVDAIHQGKLTEAKVREAVRPLFYTRFRLGEFDPPNMNPYMKLNLSVVESPAHQQLAVETALKSFVLLKNNGILPLKQSHYDNIALVGPFSDEIVNLFGDYAARTDDSYKTNVLYAINHLTSNVHHADGCTDGPVCEHYNSRNVTSQLNNVDLIFVALGTGQVVEREGQDKFDYNLPGQQKQLLQDVLSHADNTPVILLLFTGSALDISFADADNRVSAIVECFLPAQATGKAVLHMLLNDVTGAVPAGRLPFTWYKSENDIGDINDYSMDGKTYRYLHVDPLYPFGYGLSYSSFSYSQLNVSHSVEAGHDLNGTVSVQNTGSFDADEAVQVYISWEEDGLPAPKVQLAWFDRVTIPKGGSKTVHFTVEGKTMALWVNDGWKISPGSMKIYVGGQQPKQKRTVPSNVLSTEFTIQGTLRPQSLVGSLIR